MLYKEEFFLRSKKITENIKGCLTTSLNRFNLKSNTIMKNHGAKIRLIFKSQSIESLNSVINFIKNIKKIKNAYFCSSITNY